MTSSPVNRKAIALLTLVFLLGAGFGVVGTILLNQRVFGARLADRSPAAIQPPGPARAVARMTQQLNLTPDQQKQIGEILADTQHRYDGVREQMNPQFDQIRQEGRDRIRQVLTADQQPKLADFYRQVDEDRRRRQQNQGR